MSLIQDNKGKFQKKKIHYKHLGFVITIQNVPVTPNKHRHTKIVEKFYGKYSNKIFGVTYTHTHKKKKTKPMS